MFDALTKPVTCTEIAQFDHASVAYDTSSQKLSIVGEAALLTLVDWPRISEFLSALGAVNLGPEECFLDGGEMYFKMQGTW